jgi:hypothetical protein
MRDSHEELQLGNYLKNMRVDVAQHLAACWSGNKHRRTGPEAKALLFKILDDPSERRALLERLPTEVRNAVGWLRWFGGYTDQSLLRAALAAGGAGAETDRAMSALRGYGISNFDQFDRMVYTYGIGDAYPYADVDPLKLAFVNGSTYFADPRLVASAAPPRIEPLNLPIVAIGSADLRMRRPQSTVLDLLRLFRAMRTNGGLRRLKTGDQDLRKSDVTKIEQALGWDKNPPLDDALDRLILALYRADVLSFDRDAFVYAPMPEADALLQHDFSSTARWLLVALLNTERSDYRVSSALKVSPHLTDMFVTGICLGLFALPFSSSGGSFVSIDDYADGLLARIHPATVTQLRTHSYNSVEMPAQTAMRKAFRLLVQQQLCDVAAFLGLVEIALNNGAPFAFRLTAHGAQTLHNPVSADEQPQPLRSNALTPCWLVQPNYDMIVFLEAIDPAALFFAQHIAELREASTHTATLRLSRESITNALQQGLSIDELLATLAKGSRAPLPGNVQTELRNWANLRENYVLEQDVTLISFADRATRDGALADGQGTALGDRYIQLSRAAKMTMTRRVDHNKHAQFAHLRIGGAGDIIAHGAHAEWYLAPLLDRCAKPVRNPPLSWQLDEKSVRASGINGVELAAFFEAYSEQKLPKLLGVALANWGRKRAPSASTLEKAWVLRCPNAETFAAILQSESVLPAIISSDSSTRAIVIDAHKIADVRAVLRWAGIAIDAERA